MVKMMKIGEVMIGTKNMNIKKVETQKLIYFDLFSLLKVLESERP